ncbi:serine protease [Ruegeria marina]|uniref:Putative peptidoglycan binding domain-containing protein n=1 Tax=Ruegeria marina TaxID=639004 RepID=A0A1G6YVV0_9RHOB|nr:serine protease [Ruegeria marina]SDD93765.1 Putative peptidoglycan binding domain-containing protein [Ruegeria marina]
MTRLFAVFLSLVSFVASPLLAQSDTDVVWVQIEAQPDLQTARARAQDYTATLEDVAGFLLGSGWYGIVLGPYLRPDAEQVLNVYRAERRIPADSFITLSSALGQQFWPIGANVLGQDAVIAPVEQAAQPAAPTAQPEPADETLAEARRSEQALSREERQDLQIALQAAGFYNAAIDGAFGAGTRRSMADWQASNGYEVTGVLTTLQRKALMDQYNAPLISVGMTRRYDAQAGIEMDMPLGAVRFSRYEPPFAHYEATGDEDIRVLLISQPGDKATLFGLYDIMQTLEIVPLDGPRERDSDSFTLEGRGKGIVSYTEAALEGGEIKGFTLVWPQGDEERRARVLAAMKQSFTRTEGVLDPAAGGEAEQRVDLVSGLQIRKPRLSRSGFYVDGAGTVMTVAEAVTGCTRVTLDHNYEAQVIDTDAGLGVAVLRPAQPMAPMQVADLATEDPRIAAEVVLSGFSYEGILGAPTLSFGSVADVAGLRGEIELARLNLMAQAGDAGGPILDASGAVVGMLLAEPATGQQLPRDVSFAAKARALRDVLAVTGIPARDAGDPVPVTPDEISRRANGMTVLVSCWN